MITIVTSRSYLLCEAINHISLRADPERITNTKYLPYYCIDINFVPINRNGNSGNNSASLRSSHNEEAGFVTIKIMGENKALQVFKEVVSQIREQLPDQMYLDKMLEDILSGSKDIHDDVSPTALDRTGQPKRKRKKVLRKPNKRR